MDELLKREKDALNALWRWLDEHPPSNESGEAMVWSDGRPVAFDVLRALDQIASRLARDI
jgi:hypothetical protein